MSILALDAAVAAGPFPTIDEGGAWRRDLNKPKASRSVASLPSPKSFSTAPSRVASPDGVFGIVEAAGVRSYAGGRVPTVAQNKQYRTACGRS